MSHGVGVNANYATDGVCNKNYREGDYTLFPSFPSYDQRPLTTATPHGAQPVRTTYQAHQQQVVQRSELQPKLSKHGYQTQPGSFLGGRSSGPATTTNIEAQQSGKIIRVSQQKQRAASAKKELIATYSSGMGAQNVHHNAQTSKSGAPTAWSMVNSTFGEAMIKEQDRQNMDQVVQAQQHHHHRPALMSANPATNQGKEVQEPLIPVRYLSNQATRSTQDWQQQKHHQNANSAMSNIVVQTSDKKHLMRGKNKSRKESSGNAATSGFATDKKYIVAARYDSSVGFLQGNANQSANASQGIMASSSHREANSSKLIRQGGKQKKQPPTRVPPQLDTRVNYQGGIRIISSVLTPNNPPRSAATTKPYPKDSGRDGDDVPHGATTHVRNITSAGQAPSSKPTHMFQIQRTNIVGGSHITAASGGGNNFNGSGQNAFQAMDAQMSGGASSKVVTQQLLNMHRQSNNNNESGSNTNNKKATTAAQQQLQFTYANAMPRLASANAYLTKQSRKLRPTAAASQKMNVKNKGAITSTSAAAANSSDTNYHSNKVLHNNNATTTATMGGQIKNSGGEPQQQMLHGLFVKNNSFFPAASAAAPTEETTGERMFY